MKNYQLRYALAIVTSLGGTAVKIYSSNYDFWEGWFCQTIYKKGFKEMRAFVVVKKF